MHTGSSQMALPICTRPDLGGARPKLRTSIGQTVTQMPQPMELELALVMDSCLRAKRITSIPTTQLRVHSPQAMHFSLEAMRYRLMPSRL